MPKPTKNILTLSYVENELRFYNTADIRSTLVLGTVLTLFFLPLTVLTILLIQTVIDTPLLSIPLCLFFGLLLSSPCWLHVRILAKHLQEKKQLQRGEFEVEIRKVGYKSEKIVARHTEQFLSFEGFRDISVNSTTYALADYGDVFYLVHYRGKNEIKLLFSEKAYEWK